MPAQTTRAWHALEISEIASLLGTSQHGLTEAEAAQRLAQDGPNRLPRTPPPAIWVIFLRQFQSPLIYVLGVAGSVALAIGERADAGFIFGVLVLNAIIGGTQEWRAEKSSHGLGRLIKTNCTVVRDGEAREMDAEALVRGDVVWLESGIRVPADVRLIGSQGLTVDESLLTGESLATSKCASFVGAPDTLLGDRQNMAHAGSIVARGRGRGLVVATGADTVVGRLARDVTGAPAGKPPLLIRLERFTRVIGVAVLAAAALVALVGVFGKGFDWVEMFLFAVALAVSAIPEGLPVTLTVALAVATTRMARRGVVVRRLAAVEGLGSCTLVASDKTGTLTCNELTVKSVVLADGSRFEVTGEGYAPNGELYEAGAPLAPERRPALDSAARVATLCNEAHLLRRDDAWSWHGDPTDIALLSFAHKLGWMQARTVERYPEVASIPFEPERKYAATFHAELLCVKGAPERVLPMCDLSEGERERHMQEARALAAEGKRVLALAEGACRGEPAHGLPPAEPTGLGLVALVGIFDPLRPGVQSAIATCHRAGIKTTMITGDHPLTAFAIARELGLATRLEEVVSGAEILTASDEQVAAMVDDVRVFARVAPEQKLQIVRAARLAGHFVAVTGDGVNDAPALRAANIGVAMGKAGTDVAREAAELVITDDNFATIVAGVEEGRVAYDNVRKVVYLLISTGAAEVVLVCGSLVAGLPLPLLPVQLLWLNLVTNGIQDVALAFEPGEKGTLERPPRAPTERVFDRLMTERTVIGALVMGLVALAAFDWMIQTGFGLDAARNSLLLLMVLFENIHIGNCRSETASVFDRSPLASPVLLLGAVLAFGVHFASLYVPAAQAVLGTSPVGATTWLVLVALALTITVAMELHKWLWRVRRRGAPPRTGAPTAQTA